MSVHESSDGDDTTTSGGVSPLSPADVVVSIAALVETARQDPYSHALCANCYPQDFFEGGTGLGLMVTSCGTVSMLATRTDGGDRERCPQCVALVETQTHCPQCGLAYDA